MPVAQLSKSDIRNFRIKLAIINYVILIAFLFIGELLNSLFNLRYDWLAYNLKEKFILGFRPSVIAIFSGMFVIQYLFIDIALRPLYAYLLHGTSLTKARVAAISIPWRLLAIQTLGWTIGTTVFYALNFWKVSTGIPFALGLTLKLSGGFMATIYAAIVNNLMLIPFKTRLNILDIQQGENDLFMRIKEYLIAFAGVVYIISAYTYLLFYYSQGARILDISHKTPVFISVGLFYLLIIVGATILSKYEYYKQMHFLKNRIKELLSENANATERVKLLYFDDVGEFGALFNQFLDKFVSVVDDVKASSSTLNDSMQNLSTSTKEITTTSNQQAAAVKEVVSTMEDATAIAQTISSSIQEVVRIATKTRENVAAGVRLVNQNLSKMDDIRIKNVDTIGGIRSLIDKIQSIWDIVDIINSIVDQTRIIAFNASLEASTAGEAGKNFQIVAAEIKRLADNTSESTTEIRQKINEIQKASNNLIIVSEEGSEKIRQGCDISNDVGTVFQEILSSAEISASSSESIAGSIDVQTSSFEQILVTMKEIAAGIENFVVSSRQTMTIVDELRKLAAVLEDGVKKYKTKEEAHDE